MKAPENFKPGLEGKFHGTINGREYYASDRLTPAQIDYAVEAVPWYALRYDIHRLTPEQLDRAKAAVR